MSDIQADKLELFEQEIMERARAERDAIVAETERLKREALKEEEDRLLEESFRRIQTEVDRIKTDGLKELSRETLELKKQLFRQREQDLSRMIADARVELQSFAGGEGYEAYFLGKIQALAADWKLEGSTVKVRPEDLRYEKQIKRLYGDCTVETDGERVSLGGAVLVNPARGIEVDMSLDAALAEQREWFYHNSNFNFD